MRSIITRSFNSQSEASIVHYPRLKFCRPRRNYNCNTSGFDVNYAVVTFIRTNTDNLRKVGYQLVPFVTQVVCLGALKLYLLNVVVESCKLVNNSIGLFHIALGLQLYLFVKLAEK